MKSCTSNEFNLNLAKYYPGSKRILKKAHLYPDMEVAMREVTLTNGQTLPLYDTSGIYTTPEFRFDINTGLPKIRKKLSDKPLTQLAYLNNYKYRDGYCRLSSGPNFAPKFNKNTEKTHHTYPQIFKRQKLK